MPFDLALNFPLAIPVWSQYVNFLKWSLEEIGELTGNGGLAIVIFTIIVRTLILPVTVRSIRSMKSMQDIQPKIKELQKKYKSDRAKLQQETMALYQAYGVNPIAGCLPMLLQIPIFIGVYQAINSLSNSGTGVWAEGFLWLPDLSEPDPYYILPFVAAAFQFIQTQMSRPAGQGKVTDPQQAMMNTMMNLMPLTVIFFGLTFASGAVLYWAVQSIYGIIQQWFITGWGKLKDYFPNLPELPENRRLGYKPPRDLDAIDTENLPPKKQGPLGRWWQKQMDNAQAVSEERRAATNPSTSTAVGAGAATAAATQSAKSGSTKSTGATKSERPYARNSPKGRMLADQAKRESAAAAALETDMESADADTTVEPDSSVTRDVTTSGTPSRKKRATK